jgi:hypothetical protein
MSGDLRNVPTRSPCRGDDAQHQAEPVLGLRLQHLLIPVAAGALYPALGMLLSPVFAAGAMALSSVEASHVGALQEKIAELQAMSRTLEHLANHCHGDHRPECPIIDGLADAGRAEEEEAAPTPTRPLRKTNQPGF